MIAPKDFKISRPVIMKEKINRILAKRHLIPFSERVYPGFESPRHIKYLAEILERAERREEGFTRIIIHMPPQHGKSTAATKIFPAWWMGRNPNDDIISTSYAASLALKHSASTRSIVTSGQYQAIFPGMALSPDSKAKNLWNARKPHTGSFSASGIMGGITGKGADLLLIDDPLKNRAEAESPLMRDKQIQEYKSTLSTRMHKNSVVILIMTRWHKGDLAGWLMDESGEGYIYIRLPALAEENDPLGRREREPLWQSHFPFRFLKQKRRMMGEYDWWSMYQGLPRPPEGNLLKRHYFKIVDHAPPNIRWVRYWDLATSEDRKADFTATIKGGMDDRGNVFLDKCWRDRMEWPDVRKEIITVCRTETGVLTGVESVGMQKGMIQALWRDKALVGYGIIAVPSVDDKRIRAIPLSTRGDIGKLYLVKGDWNEDFIEEAVDFPNGEHDDRIDCATGVMSLLTMYYGDELLNTEIEGLERKGKEDEDNQADWKTEQDERTDKFKQHKREERERELEAGNQAVFVG